MRLNKKLFKNSKGDTIVEVLLAVAVMSLVLAISYNLSNKSSQFTRTAQERGEAQKLAEEQLERLRNYITQDTDWEGDSFLCFDAEGNPTPDSSLCRFGPENRYEISVIRTDDKTYTSTVQWDTLSGNPATLELSYRLDPTPFNVGEREITEIDLSATAVSQTRVDLFWNNDINPVSGIARYQILRGSTVLTSNFVGVTPQLTYADNGLSPATTYTYTVRALNAAGAVIKEEQATVTTPPVPIPTSLTATATSPNTVNLSWSAVSIPGIVGYQIYRGVGSGTRQFIATSGTNTYQNNGLSANTNYRYTIRAIHSSGSVSGDSNIATVTTPNPPPPRQPLYRCYQFYLFQGNPMRLTNHFYTTNAAQCNGGTAGGHLEGIIGYVPLSNSTNPGAVPMYGGYAPSSVDDFYTISHAEYVNAHNWGWNVNSGVRFWVYPSSIAGTIALHRWNSPCVGNHFYTTNAAENPNNFSPLDGGGCFTYEGVAGYVFQNP